MQFLTVIPARYASTRFEGKPLADVLGLPMVVRTYWQAAKIFDHVIIATDDSRIEETALRHGCRVVMTADTHPSGTDRVKEAADKYAAYLDEAPEIIVNLQGDEPFICVQQLKAIKNCFSYPGTQIATLARRFGADEDVFDPNAPKVVFSSDGNALYFSRSVIPYLRGTESQQWHDKHTYYKHIGLYAYRREVLDEIAALPVGVLEQAESLEQLRWLEAGYRIRVAVTQGQSYGIDTPEDLQRVTALFSREDNHTHNFK